MAIPELSVHEALLREANIPATVDRYMERHWSRSDLAALLAASASVNYGLNPVDPRLLDRIQYEMSPDFWRAGTPLSKTYFPVTDRRAL